jgi:CTD kinase subunit alpha
MLELYVRKPIFQGNDEIHQLDVIYSLMGTPNEETWPGVATLPWYELVKPKETLESRFIQYATKYVRDLGCSGYALREI